MDRDRIVGAVKSIGGKVKEAVGRPTGDPKTIADGQAEQKVGTLKITTGLVVAIRAMRAFGLNRRAAAERTYGRPAAAGAGHDAT